MPGSFSGAMPTPVSCTQKRNHRRKGKGSVGILEVSGGVFMGTTRRTTFP